MVYKCKNCGGNTVYHPDKRSMYCPYCDGIDSEKEVTGTSAANCINCGAPLEVGEFISACRCQHCGSYIIMDERVENEYEPHMIIPFKVSKEKAVELLRKEFKTRFFTPTDFLSEATLDAFEGMYVPFWTYDYLATYEYSGVGTKVRTWRTGKTEHVETSYYRVVRKMEADFDKIPVDASDEMKDELMDLIEPYDYRALEEFHKKYLSGFWAERYNQGMSELEPRAQKKAKKDADQLLKESMMDYNTLREESKHLKLQRQTANYALLPVWVYHYSYKGQKYDYHINGQTGKVLGKTPIDKIRVLLYGATIYGLLGVMLSLAKMILEVL